MLFDETKPKNLRVDALVDARKQRDLRHCGNPPRHCGNPPRARHCGHLTHCGHLPR